MSATSSSKYTTVIFDLGDVLFSWSSKTTTCISPRTLKAIISSPTWFDYERGRLTQDACYELIGNEFSLDPLEVERAFDQARDSLQSNEEVISFVREVKTQSNGKLDVFAASNISLPDYDVLRTKPADWDIFDEIFTSGTIGERKPNLGFYRHVLAKTGVDPRSTIFIDDKLENVLSARSLGFHGIIFDNSANIIKALRNLLGDPVKRGREFLQQNAGRLESVTDGGIVLKENFAQLLILEATNDRNLVTLSDPPRTWNFWQGKPLLTTEEFPFDLDTTSIGLTVTNQDDDVISSVMDEMLEYTDSDGIIQTYFDHRRPRFDPVVCLNALALFYTHGRGSELRPTLQWVHEVLLNRAYLDGTRYYATAECFLYFASRLLGSSGDEELHDLLHLLLKERVQERIGAEGDSLALSMRILTCASVGVRDEVDMRTLLPMQCEDGGWEIGWVYKYGSSGVRIGNRGLTTAFAINAIEALNRLPSSRSSSFSSLGKPTPTPATAVVQETFVGKVTSTLRAASPTFRIRSSSLSYPLRLSCDTPPPPPLSVSPSPTESPSFIRFESPTRCDEPTTFTPRHAKRRSLNDKLRWLWHGGKLRQPIEARF